MLLFLPLSEHTPLVVFSMMVSTFTAPGQGVHFCVGVPFQQKAQVLVFNPASLSPFCSQGERPHVKEKKRGVKGTKFPLDLLLCAPSVPSQCHSTSL